MCASVYIDDSLITRIANKIKNNDHDKINQWICEVIESKLNSISFSEEFSKISSITTPFVEHKYNISGKSSLCNITIGRKSSYYDVKLDENLSSIKFSKK